jgi:hypothetical protein
LWAVRQPFVLSLLALLLPASVLAWRAPEERRIQERMACTLAWALFLPFLASTWNSSPRYFAPAWAAALVCLAGQLARRRPGLRALSATAALALGLMAIQTLFLAGVYVRGLSLTEHPFVPLQAVRQMDQWQESMISKDCVARFSSGYAWAKPADFVLSSLDPQEAAAKAAAHGRTLCPVGRP